MTEIPGLRSPYDTVGGIVHFGRMLDKIRLHAVRQLPEEWVAAKGLDRGFDGRCCRFLGIGYQDLEERTLSGGSDDEILEWAQARGKSRDSEEIETFNDFLRKLGWRDPFTERVHIRLAEIGQPVGTVLTMFDFIDLDEGRPPRWT